ncbi:MAG: sulfurtransferase complex subunit TusB [Pseudomonadales bacterium]|nr:sulfurtransferase complex subunit TusB [Pseudomonadales bacterium]
MNLHIIHKSANTHQSAHNALHLIHQDDYIILIDDGIYNAISQTDISQAYLNTAKRCFLLNEHALARGIENTDKNFTHITMAEFVELSLIANNNISWY